VKQDVSTHLRGMDWSDIDTVLHIEQEVHSHPWTRGNFNDALATGNICRVYQAGDEIIGYAVLMPALDDVDLLDISIAKSHQRRGLGEKLLNEMIAMLREQKFQRIMLEVRRTNLAAYALYRKVGFVEIGVRRDYYPLGEGREDALVLEYSLGSIN